MHKHIILGCGFLPKKSKFTELVCETLKGFKLIDDTFELKGVAYYKTKYATESTNLKYLGISPNDSIFTTVYSFEHNISFLNNFDFVTVNPQQLFAPYSAILKSLEKFKLDLNFISIPAINDFRGSTGYEKLNINQIEED